MSAAPERSSSLNRIWPPTSSAFWLRRGSTPFSIHLSQGILLASVNAITSPFADSSPRFLATYGFRLPLPLNNWTGYLRIMSLLRSEEHTSELQSRGHLVCRLLLEKKNIIDQILK